MPASSGRAHVRRSGARAAIILVVLTGFLLAGRRFTASGAGEGTPVPRGFTREVGLYRLTSARFSVSRRYTACTIRLPVGGTIPRTTCPAAPAGVANSHAVRSATAGSGADPLDPRRYAAALVDVLWADSAGISLDRSISFLETAARVARNPAVALADLSGAYLARAEMRQAPEDLFRALDAATRSSRLHPGNPVACFNRALALEYIGADRNAAIAWGECAMTDSRSGWGHEARRRAGSAAAAADTVVALRPAAADPPERVEAFVAADPGGARAYGWEEVLGAWGEAALRGDSAAARQNLVLARAIADALARRGGDRTLTDAVQAIGAAMYGGEGWRRLALGHQAYARATRAYRDEAHTAARPHVEHVLALRPPSEALVGWARRLEGLVRMAEGDYPAAADWLAVQAASADTLRHPALAASFHQIRGTVLLRGNRFQDARAAMVRARRLFDRTGEREHAGAARYLQADVEFLLGAPEAQSSMHAALAELRTFRRSRWLHTALSVLALELADQGLPYAARAIYDEGLEVARATGNPIYEAEARLLRAQLLVSMGERAAAEADVAIGERIVRRLQAGERRDWFQAELHAARAVLLVHDDPARAAAEMDLLLAAPDGARTGPRILAGLLGRAQARLTAGDVRGATLDLDSATQMIGEQVAAPLLRASVLDAARETFDQLVMLRLARGDTAGALRSLERGRSSLGHGREAEKSGEGWTLPPGTAALEYALVGDTLLAWAVTPRSVVLHRRTVDRAAFLRTVERLRTVLEEHAAEAELRPLLAALYADLVQPLRAVLPERSRLAVVADGELADVPFAALYDARAGRYLVEAYTVLAVSSLRDVRALPVRPKGDAPALFVSDPAFDPSTHPGLSRLPGAVAEVEAATPLYGRREVLADAAADVQAVTSRLPRASVFHFAGHAVFDDGRPERSFLLLASGADDPGGGRLTAARVAGLDLRAVDLVVLSGCETLRSPGGRSGGFAGLAGALLTAGANGVVGSPWRVRDGTSRRLMADLHAGYRRTGDAAASLRNAQLLALRSHDPALRTPAAWGAFRYVAN